MLIGARDGEPELEDGLELKGRIRYTAGMFMVAVVTCTE